MREIRPYKTVRGATRALDNGGRFFNLFAKAGDDIVDSAELAKAAGVYSTGQQNCSFRWTIRLAGGESQSTISLATTHYPARGRKP
jgi:hypothetical protein